MPTLAVGTGLALATLCLVPAGVGEPATSIIGSAAANGRTPDFPAGRTSAEDRGENLIVQPDGRSRARVSYEDRLLVWR